MVVTTEMTGACTWAPEHAGRPRAANTPTATAARRARRPRLRIAFVLSPASAKSTPIAQLPAGSYHAPDAESHHQPAQLRGVHRGRRAIRHARAVLAVAVGPGPG